MKKYSDELRKEIQDKFLTGATYSEISKEYNIHYKTIETILQEDTESEKRNVIKSLFSNCVKVSEVDSKTRDSRAYKIWCYKLQKHLAATMKYNNLQVVYIGNSWFTYIAKQGYTKTHNFIDLYKKIGGVIK